MNTGKKLKNGCLIGLFFLVLLLMAGCTQKIQPKYSPRFAKTNEFTAGTYSFAIHPFYNPERLYDIFNPLIDYLNKNIKGVRFVLVPSRDYGAFEEKLYKSEFQFALPNPYQTIKARNKHYKVFGKMGDDNKFTGVILLRKDSPLKNISDLKGRKISYPSATALAACMMPQYYLYEHGLDPVKDVQSVFVGSQESSILSVYFKNTDAACTWPVPWLAFQKAYPDKARELYLKWETKPFINNSLMVRDDVDPLLVRKVAQLLFHLHETPEGQAILRSIEISRFDKADNAAYDVVLNFLKKFSARVRPVSQD